MIVDPPADYPRAYLLCKVCGAPAALPCISRSGRIVEGQPDGVAVTIDRPHISRKRSTRAEFNP